MWLQAICSRGHRRTYDAKGRVQFTVQRFAKALIAATGFDDTNFDYGVISESVYDDAGQLIETIQHTNARLQFNGTTYTEAPLPGQPTESIVSTSTTFQYDLAGRQVGVTDALRHQTRTRYDQAGRAVQTTFHDGTITKTEFNTLGQRVAEIAQHDPGDPSLDLVDITTRYRYDPQGRLTHVILPPVTHPTEPGNPLVHPVYEYIYDRYGNQVVSKDSLYIDASVLAANPDAAPTGTARKTNL